MHRTTRVTAQRQSTAARPRRAPARAHPSWRQARADLEMLGTLIIGARTQAISWARARLSEQARELDDLKARF